MPYNNPMHDMYLDKDYDGDGEKWACPDCGRRMVIYCWLPMKKEIVEVGDDEVSHSISRGVEDGPLPQNRWQALLRDVDFSELD